MCSFPRDNSLATKQDVWSLILYREEVGES